MTQTKQALDWFGKNGALAKTIPNFRIRPQQQLMAETVQLALENSSVAVIEAGTGVGKTFAYLMPALAMEEQVIVSTASKTLQDQLFFKDLPIVKKSLHSDAKLALLKGRANYLCLYRLELASSDAQFHRRSTLSHLNKIKDWAKITRLGDIAEVSTVPNEAEIWPYVTSTPTNCLGADCEMYDNCHVVKARRKAQKADVLVVNHHLFLADLSFKEKGFEEFLPQAETIIIDEAHQLPDIASHFFSQTVSSYQLQQLLRDTEEECLTKAADTPDLQDAIRIFEKAIKDFRLALDKPGQRAPWYTINTRPPVIRGMKQLIETADELTSMLKQVKQRSKGLQNCFKRLKQQAMWLQQMQQPQDNAVQWFETFTRSFSLVSTPLNVAESFRKQMEKLDCSWVMTSATLAVNNSFEHFMNRLGIPLAYQQQLDSPFDFWHHTLLYAPPDMPMPHESHFVTRLIETAVPVIQACGGRTFMLFTSYKSLNEVAKHLKHEIDYPILVQGSMPQHKMIKRFRKLGNAVLLGTGTFWEGVDVRGAALSCVIIDKLPFAAPNEPVLEARIQAIRQAGRNPFFEYQLPQAVLALKQGVGRLIRDENDKGLLVICDPRLRSKNYGRIFMQSLPNMPKTQKIEVVKRFFKHWL